MLWCCDVVKKVQWIFSNLSHHITSSHTPQSEKPRFEFRPYHTFAQLIAVTALLSHHEQMFVLFKVWCATKTSKWLVTSHLLNKLMFCWRCWDERWWVEEGVDTSNKKWYIDDSSCWWIMINNVTRDKNMIRYRVNNNSAALKACARVNICRQQQMTKIDSFLRKWTSFSLSPQFQVHTFWS